MLQRYLIIWLTVSSLLAFAWPAEIGFDPFVASKPYFPYLIGLTMFAIGMMLPHDEVRIVLRGWPLILGGTAVQYAVMPLLALAAAKTCGLSGDYLIGVALVGCVPGAMASNVLTLNAKGNTSYSVSLTTMATLVSPLAVPLVLGLVLAADKSIHLPFADTSFKLLLTVVLPVISGHIFCRVFPDWQARIEPIAGAFANLTILWIIAAVVGLTREPLSEFHLGVFVALLAVNLGGYSAGYFSGWLMKLPEPMRRALTLEVGMQNAGLGAVLATQIFPDREAAAIAPAMYTFGCMLTGTILARYWSARSLTQPSTTAA